MASPNIAKSLLVCSDTAGSVATAAPKGGIVIISGTKYIKNIIPTENESYCDYQSFW